MHPREIQKKTRRRIRGSALLICVGTVLLAAALAATLLSLASTSSRLAYRSWQKTQADVLAESGIEQMYAQVANAYAGQSVNNNPIPPTSVVGTIGASSVSDGSYSAKVISNTTATSGGVTTTTYVIEGDGTCPDGSVTSKQIASFSESTNGVAGGALGDMAIKSAGSINMSGGSYTKDPTGTHGAAISANGSITDSSAGLTIDGTAYYYLASTLTGKAYTTNQLTSPATFPDSTTTTNWRSLWLSQAQEATTSYPSGHIINGNASYSANKTITAPLYITGNLTMSGGHQLTVAVDPSAPKPCVLFVHGTLTISGGSSLLNQGVVIVTDGAQTFSGGSNVYGVTDTANSALISYSTDLKNAIVISGGSGAAQIGAVYAINGGATLSGGSSYYGSLTTGGVGSTTTLSGGSSVSYSPGFNNGINAFVAQWTPTSLSKWVALK